MHYILEGLASKVEPCSLPYYGMFLVFKRVICFKLHQYVGAVEEKMSS